MRAEKLGQADDLRAQARGFADVLERGRKFASGSAPMRICTRATVNLRAVVIHRLSEPPSLGICGHDSKANPARAELASESDFVPLIAGYARSVYSSRISTAAAMVVVHLPRLSPTADWVMLLVRTILLEMR